MIDPRVIPWETIYKADSLEDAAASFLRNPRAPREMLAGVRGIAQRFDCQPGIPSDRDPEVKAVEPPLRSIMLLGATTSGGCVGHIAAYIPRGRRQELPSTLQQTYEIPGAEDVLDAVLETMAPLAPEAPRPTIEYVLPMPAEGDSYALAAGIVAVLAILGAKAAPSVAATGGWDQAARRFTPVPPETIASKLSAARRWGIKRVIVIEGQEGIPQDESLQIVRIPSHPGALPLASVEFAAQEVGDAGVRRALGLYDMQVARNHQTPIESIFEVTERFVDPEVCRDPVLRQIAADIRSRACLHRGRSNEAGAWLGVALDLRGRSFLPDGLVGDYLLYQQAAHHSITRIDHGEFEDPPGGPNVHEQVGVLIGELSGRWCTRHQSLCRIFLRNTRARRMEYLARLNLDPSLLPAAQEDLLAEREHWQSLIEDYASNELRMGDTNVRRMHNQLIDLAVTQASLVDPAAYGSIDWEPPVTDLAKILQEFVWTEGVDGVPADASAYDVVALLKWWWLQGSADAKRIDSARNALGASIGFPASLAAEFLMRLGCDSARAVVEHAFSVNAKAEGILSILALRSARFIDRPLQDVAIPPEGTALRELSARLRSNADLAIARCPY